jgi:hypothetical protein
MSYVQNLVKFICLEPTPNHALRMNPIDTKLKELKKDIVMIASAVMGGHEP